MDYNNRGAGERTNNLPNDFYSTPEYAVLELLDIITPSGDCLEPCNGMNAIGQVLPADTTLKIDIDTGMVADIYKDFFAFNFGNRKFDYIITNPPFNTNGKLQWASKCLDLLKPGGTLALLLKLSMVETPSRADLFQGTPLKSINVFTKRITMCDTGAGIVFAWFIWESGYTGKPIFNWIRNDKREL